MSFSADHHNELFFHHFGATPTHVVGVGGVPSANDLHQHPHIPSSCGFNHWGEYIWTGVIHVVVVEDIC